MRRTHKRAESYFSIFTIHEEHSEVDRNSRSASNVRRAKSTELLADPKELETQIEQELEDKVHELRGQRKYSSVTIPTAVKYSVTGETPNKQPELAFAQAMATPRKGEIRDYQQMLDQTLLTIRQQLNALSSERVQMEVQMEELTNGIKEARTQCSRRCFTQAASTSLRRICSHSEAKSHSVSPHVVKRNFATRDEVDGAAAQGNSDDSSSTNTSPNDSPVLCRNDSYIDGSSQGGEGFSDSLASSVSQSISESVRSESISSVRSKGSSVHFRDASLTEVFTDEYLTIPELPESPRLDLPELPCSPSVRRRSSSIFGFKDFTTKQEFSSLPPSLSKLHFRNSMPESVLNNVVFEDEEVSLNYGDSSLSQSQSSCTDEGSPKCGGIILRRSSLTGQLEHIRKPKKRNSSFDKSPPENLRSDGPRFNSAANLSRPSRTSLPAKSTRKRRTRIILPGIETTV